MNIYKNLMFLHGHFVDPRDADPDEDGAAEPAAARTTTPAVSRPVQVAGARPARWRDWLLLWPRETARVEPEAGLDGKARGCA